MSKGNIRFSLSLSLFQDVALLRPTRQSSSINGGTAGRAVDGLKSPIFEDNSCTRTRHLPKPPWWRVDLGSSLPVAEVSVVNRACAGACAERLKAFEIWIGKYLQGCRYAFYWWGAFHHFFTALVYTSTICNVQCQLTVRCLRNAHSYKYYINGINVAWMFDIDLC